MCKQSLLMKALAYNNNSIHGARLCPLCALLDDLRAYMHYLVNNKLVTNLL